MHMMSSQSWLRLLLAVLFHAVVINGQRQPPAGRSIVNVRYGYFPEARPSHAACALGWFDLDVPATNTYYKVACFPQTSGGYAASRLDNLQLDIANLGSTPWAAAAARGIDAKVVYVSHFMGNSQGLFVRPDVPELNYTGIVTPYDLKGKFVGVPFGSTIHYQILFLIDMFGLDGQVTLLDMSPSEIIAAWDELSPPVIDAAGCWGVARDRLLRGGNGTAEFQQPPAKTLASSGLLSSWGRPTFVVTAVTRTFAQAHPDFLSHFVGILARINDSFLDRLGEVDPRNVKRWDIQEPAGVSLVPSIVDAMMLAGETPGSPSTGKIFLERQALDEFIQYSAADQLSCESLGSIGSAPGLCNKPTLQHKATVQTAEFLLDQKLLSGLGPLSIMGDEGDDAIPTCEPGTFCGSDMYDNWFLHKAIRPCVACHPVGPYADLIQGVGSEAPNAQVRGPDEVLATLEDYDDQFNRSAFAPTEVGRDGGDSTCLPYQYLDVSGSGTFGDGAHATRGKRYSNNLSCEWQLPEADCVETGECDGIIEVTFQRLRLWSGDFLRVYSSVSCASESETRVLLAQLSGLYDSNDTLPVIRARGCITVVFETDSNEERVYGDDEGYGFLASYNNRGKSVGCRDNSDCNGQPCEQGLCVCGGESWGADCSQTRACLGRSRITLEGGGKAQVLKSSGDLLERDLRLASLETTTQALSPSEAYPNDLDCTFEVALPDGHDYVMAKIWYDLEPSFDLLVLQSGSQSLGATADDDGAEVYAVLTGTQSVAGQPDVYFVPAKSEYVSFHLTTDSRGRRRGVYATVEALKSEDVIHSRSDHCDPGRSGAMCEFDHCTGSNELVPARQRSPGTYVAGRIVSQSPDWPGVPAMPWSADAGCTWDVGHRGQPPPDDIVALRLVFNSPLDLEPHPITAVGDKLVIRTASNTDGTELFVERCNTDEVCSFPWQTGVCGENGGCIVRNAVDVDLSSADDITSAVAALVTDRNDGNDIKYNGLDMDVLYVKECSSDKGQTHCEAGGGKCIDGACYCEDGVACSCPCDGEPPLSTGMKIGIVLGVVIPLFLLFFGFFFFYRRRKISKSRFQKSIIVAKEAELEEFRHSVVGMCTATKKYVPSVPECAKDQSKNFSEDSTPNVLWCWKETATCMGQHDSDKIVGDPAECWIKYGDEQNAKMETAFQAQQGSGEYSPMPGYVVNFDTMVQTKVATGFQREVQRNIEDQSNSDDHSDFDMADVEVGHDKLPDELADEPQMVLVEGDVIQISKQRQDGWGFGSKLHHADEALSRQLVSWATGGGSNDDASILTDTGWFPLDVTRVPKSEDLALLQKNVGDTSALDPPPCWDPIVDPTVLQMHELVTNDSERMAVETAFKSTLSPTEFGTVQVLNVKRIQNLAMWQSYVVKRQTICYRETGAAGHDGSAVDTAQQAKALERFERRWLWHGTNVEVMDKILQQGFNRSFCGKNATVYGKGVYFARDSRYSAGHTYAVPDNKGQQVVLACRVVVGEYCKGEYNALTPDLRDASKNILYDATVDSMSAPSIYVTYHDSQAYPEYLITFKTSR